MTRPLRVELINNFKSLQLTSRILTFTKNPASDKLLE